MSKPVTVKFVSKNRFDPSHFEQLPNRHPDLRVTVDKQAQQYDWYVVYDDLPRKRTERFSVNREQLSCPPENTILITYEPSSIKFYGKDYTDQFEYVFTSHEPDELDHPSRLNVPPVGRWYYGNVSHAKVAPTPDQKTGIISTFHSAKAQQHTLHRMRMEFIANLKTHIPELTYYGRDFQWVEHKYQGINPYKYHIAVENHYAPHHWTEKLSDSFLGLSLPFYCGCTNLTDYFPKESFISIDLRDQEGAARIIHEAIANNEFEKRLPALMEARRLVMEEYNLTNYIGDCIKSAASRSPANRKKSNNNNGVILSRHLMMRKSPIIFARYALAKTLRRQRNLKKIRDFCD